MKNTLHKPHLAVIALVHIVFMMSNRAGTITNNFDTAADFVANGLVGTMWDGIYLGFGDVIGGDNGGDGNGSTIVANANISFPGFLTVQSVNSSWAGAGDDGFFLYKLVSGDFDVSVEVASPFDPQNFHFAGLLVRAAALPNGGPFNPTGTNAAENWMNITRFQEFSVGDQVRYATNAADVQIGFPGDDGDTNSTRWLRITRVGDDFTFYDKTNQTDAWSVKTNLTRVDLSGTPMQVGIEQATFTPNSPQVFFTDFELGGPNVNVATPPSPPSGLTFSAPNPSGSLTLSWTAGAGASGSLVVLRANGPTTAQPAYGFTYTGNTNFGSPTNLLGGGGNYVVSVGPNTSVTVNGLGGSNNVYHAAVYSYSGSGSGISYNTDSPATSNTVGPGNLASVSFTVSPTNLPAGGAAVATLTATYSSGDSYNVSSDPNTVWVSSDPTVIVAGNGVLSGLAIGSATITATYSGVTGTNVVSVHAPVFTDNFTTAFDYLANGLAGSGWDGLYLKDGDVPHFNNGGTVGSTALLNANLSSNNVLTLQSKGNGWEGAQDNGPFLFKVVPGDFEARVHITGYSNTVAYNFVGLMARRAGAGGGPGGAADAANPFGTESHVNLWRFDQFGVTTSTRQVTDGNQVTIDQTDGESTDYWLLMTRSDGTNFNFYKKQGATDPWLLIPTAFQRPDLSNGVPLQVGLAQALYTGNSGTVWFDSFMLDSASIAGGPAPSACSNLGMTLNQDNTIAMSWTPGTNSDGSIAVSMVIMRAGGPVSEQPPFGFLSTADARFGLGTDLGSGNYVIFRDVGTNVTVSNLIPGNVYYAAVYSYSGSGATKVFNQQTAAVGSLPAGILVAIDTTLAGNGIPMGGVGLPVVQAIYNNGGGGNISSLVTFISGDTNVIVATNGVLTGLTNGTATVTASYQGFTNSLVVTVRPPTFTDRFDTNHDYIASGATNTPWDGVYSHPGAIPGSVFVSDPEAAVTVADANITSNQVLTVTSINVGWEFGQNDGFFLFKYLPNDFQAAVHLTSLDVTGFNNPGLLARAYSLDPLGNRGAPFDSGTNESWVSWTRFDEFGAGTYARLTLPVNNTTRSTQGDINSTNYWLLMVRQNGTDFSFYQRLNASDPWSPSPNGTTYSVAAFAQAPMQVGILAGGFDSGSLVNAEFDNFMLDAGPPRLEVGGSAGGLTLSWPATPVFQLQTTLGLAPADWQPAAVTPVVTNGFNTVTLPATNVTSFFRLVQ